MNDVRLSDAGLHIAVLGTLIDAGLVELDVRSRLAGIEGEERERIEEAVGRLHAVPLPTAALARITNLHFDGGSEIFLAIERALDVDTGGESDCYRMRSLDGIGLLTSLQTLDLDAYGSGDDHDLGPLANHPVLSSLTLAGQFVSLATLESLPKLAKLTCWVGKIGDDQLARLSARGVEISLR